MVGFFMSAWKQAPELLLPRHLSLFPWMPFLVYLGSPAAHRCEEGKANPRSLKCALICKEKFPFSLLDVCFLVRKLGQGLGYG